MSAADNRAAWVAALRSGQYEQGQRALRAGDRFCCLGVACDLAVKAGVIPEPATYEGATGAKRYVFNALGEVLPEEVTAWLGLTCAVGEFRQGRDSGSLSTLNDMGATFAEIADLIESGAVRTTDGAS